MLVQESHPEPRSCMQLIPTGKGKASFLVFRGVSLGIWIILWADHMARWIWPEQNENELHGSFVRFLFSCFILFWIFLSCCFFVCLFACWLACFYFLFCGFLLLYFVFWKTENIKLGEYRGRCGGPGRSWGGEKHNQNMKYEENNKKDSLKCSVYQNILYEKSLLSTFWKKKKTFSY